MKTQVQNKLKKMISVLLATVVVFTSMGLPSNVVFAEDSIVLDSFLNETEVTATITVEEETPENEIPFINPGQFHVEGTPTEDVVDLTLTYQCDTDDRSTVGTYTFNIVLPDGYVNKVDGTNIYGSVDVEVQSASQAPLEQSAESEEPTMLRRSVRALAGEQSVATLEEFNEALADVNIDKIILTADIELDATKEIATGRTITITSDDSGPYQLTIAPSARHFKLLQGANLTLENLIIEGQNKPGGVRVDSNTTNRSFLTVINTTFKNCKSTQGNTGLNFGGAIDVYDSTVGPIGYATILVTGTSNFIDNQAYYGGAIAAGNCWITIEGETKFSGNTVVGDGWGGSTLFLQTTETEIKDNVTFIGNGTTGKEGGALMLYGGGNTVISGNVIFESNQASNGGAIMSRGGSTVNTLDINGDVKFLNNTSSASGGAIYTQARTVNIATDGTSNIEFLNNTSSQYGGAIEANNVMLDVGAGTIFDGNKTLSSNSGGAIHVYSDGSTVKFNVTGTATRHVIFRNNSTASCGGALCIHGGNAANTSVIKYADIVNNYSRNFGGGVDIDQARYVTFENCLIQRNISDTDGGGIAMEDSHIDLVIKDSVLDSNSSGGKPHSNSYRVTTGGGGAISFDLGTITISDSSITNNSAPVNGGGIGYRNHATQTILLAAVKTTNTILSGNTAKRLTVISEADKPIHADKINNSEVGKSYSQNQAYAYNNFDIQYNGADIPLPKVTVTFNTRGGTPVPASQEVDYGQGVYLPNPEPSRQYSSFLGWETADGDSWDFATVGDPNTGAPVRSDMTLYAKWQSDEFQIDYELDNGTNDESNPTSYVYGEGGVSFADATRENYEFLGWFDAPSGGNLITGISDTDNGDKVLYARWKADIYQITYDYDGGTAPTTSNPTGYDVEDSFPIAISNEPTRTGYTFEGWTVDYANSALTDITTATKPYSIATGTTGNIALTAVWSLNSYDITYDYAGGTAPTTSNPTGYDVEDSFPIAISNEPTRKGYTFEGWTVDYANSALTDIIAATKPYSIAAGTTGDIKLTATWKVIDDSTTPPTTPTPPNGGNDNTNGGTIKPPTFENSTTEKKILGKDRMLPKTGDTTSVSMWMVLVVGAGILILALLKRKKEVKE